MSNGPNISLPNLYVKWINTYLDASDLTCLFKRSFILLYNVISYYTLIYSVHLREVTSWKLFSLTSLCLRFVKCAQMCDLPGYRPQSPDSVVQTQVQRTQTFIYHLHTALSLDHVPRVSARKIQAVYNHGKVWVPARWTSLLPQVFSSP